MLSLLTDLPPEGALVIWGERVAEDLHFRFVMKPGYGLHEVRGRVVAEIGRDIADSQPASTVEQALGISIRSDLQRSHLERKREV